MLSSSPCRSSRPSWVADVPRASLTGGFPPKSVPSLLRAHQEVVAILYPRRLDRHGACVRSRWVDDAEPGVGPEHPPPVGQQPPDALVRHLDDLDSFEAGIEVQLAVAGWIDELVDRRRERSGRAPPHGQQ